MPRIPVAMAGPAYPADSPALNPQRCINLFPVPGGPGGKAQAALYRTPGMARFAEPGTAPVRGMHVFGDLLFAVSGDRLWHLSESGAAREVTTPATRLATPHGRVSMADNGLVMLIVDGARGYLWDGATLAPVTDPAFPGVTDGAGPTQAAFLKGYFLVDAPAWAGRFFVSGPYAVDPAAFVGGGGTSWATAEARPDPLAALVAHGPYLWLLGEGSTEVWYPSDDVVPFDPIGGREAEVGCAAPWSVAHTPDSLFWLARGHDGGLSVVRGGAGGIEPVSTPPIGRLLELERESAATATGLTHAEGGHTFYQLNIGSRSLVFDLSTGLWHERAAWDQPNAVYRRHPADMQVHFAGRTLVGDYRTGRILHLSREHTTDDGAVLRWERVAAPVHEAGRTLFFRRLELDLETGLTGPETPDPHILLDWSDDGGHTWSTPRHLPLGAPGRYGARVAANRLGSARQRVFRVAGSDPSPTAILAAWADVDAS
ncbi:MAG: hypothetical protein OEY97_11520 [Nitrospirota bacterium]|nr:hypothetical protein [Nitrospirota bacterium]